MFTLHYLFLTAQLLDRMSECLADIAAWMRSNRLQLNTAKTEVIWCIYLDSDLMMWTHITKTVSSCFAVLRWLRSIQQSVSDLVLQTFVMALLLTKLNYGSATLAGLPAI